MPGSSVRHGAPDPGEPIVHELPPLKVGGEDVLIRVEVRRADDGAWRGRLVFGPLADGAEPATADIFCGETEVEVWEAVRDLRDHHQRDLYRSIAE